MSDTPDLPDISLEEAPGSSDESSVVEVSFSRESFTINDFLDEDPIHKISPITEYGGNDSDILSEDSLLERESGSTKEIEEENTESENWRNHKKHFFIFSNAGKPIYSRYGDESKLAGLTGVLQALISFLDVDSDTLRHAIAGDHKFVFLLKGPIYFVCVSRTSEPVPHIVQQLNYLHAQIFSILTSSVEKILSRRAQADIRNLIGGSEKLLDHLITWMDRDFVIPLNALHCLRFSGDKRSQIGSIMINSRTPNLLYGILSVESRLVNIVRPKRHVLDFSDLHLLLNFVNASANSFREVESWTPICLPHLNDGGFVHAYISFLSRDAWLMLISTKADNSVFYELSACKKSILSQLESSLLIEELKWATKTRDVRVCKSDPKILPSFLAIFLSDLTLPFSYSQSDNNKADVGVPGLWHFVYYSTAAIQITCPTFEPPYNTDKQKKRLFRLYQHLQSKVNGRLSRKVFFRQTNHENMLAWTTGGFQLYATFSPLETLPEIINGCNLLLRWIKSEEADIFILDSPVFP